MSSSQELSIFATVEREIVASWVLTGLRDLWIITVMVQPSGKPFCVFGANGDVELTGTSMGGDVAIYVLTDPRDNTVRYVGKSTRPDLRLVERKASNVTWIAELRALGMSPVMRIVDRASHEERERAEQYWIAFYSRHGSLLNKEVGGRGYAYAHYKRVKWAKRKLAGK